MLLKQKTERVSKNLSKAAQFTQNLWRLKKNYIVEENLEIRRKDQDVFSRVKKLDSNIPYGDDTNGGEAIADLVPIVNIGNTNSYIKTLSDGDGVMPFSISKSPGTEEAVIGQSTDESFIIGSKLLSINNHPTAMCTYEEIKSRLKEASYPITLELVKPFEKRSLPSIDVIMNMESDEIIQFNAFKILLHEVCHHTNITNSYYYLLSYINI